MTVASQFKTQLRKLMESISLPHRITSDVLKPNDKNIPDEFVRKRVAEQLRYGGVLEAVRVARSGFPVRLPHAEFVRLRGVGAAFPLKGDRKGCASLIEAFASDNRDAYQLGLTKVFLRKNAHDSPGDGAVVRAAVRRRAVAEFRQKAPSTNEGRFEAARGTRVVKMGGRGAGYPTCAVEAA